jgi:hypothetical protein
MIPWYAAAVPTRAEYCDYSSRLFFYVPGDPGNPFVALWQATLIDAIVLGVATLILLLVAGLAHRTGIRFLGFVYLATSLLGGLLTMIILRSSLPLVCNGAPGAPPLTASENSALDTFSSLRTLAYLTFYLTVLLAVVLIAALLLVAATRGRRASSR